MSDTSTLSDSTTTVTSLQSTSDISANPSASAYLNRIRYSEISARAVQSTNKRKESIPKLSESQDTEIGYKQPVSTEQPMHGLAERTNPIESIPTT